MEAYSIRDIPENGITLNKPLTVDWLNGNLNQGVQREELAVVALSDGQTTLELRKIDPESFGDPVIQVRGQVTAKVKAHCVRCLEHVVVDIQGAVDQTLFPADATQVAPKSSDSKDKEAELITEVHELDDDTYLGQTINLPSMVRESILLELDMNTTCDHEEQCETRTRALIEKASSTTQEPEIDPRWAALQKIQLKSE